MQFKFDAKELLGKLGEKQFRFDQAVRIYAETSAQKLEGTMRKNAPWTDRTGHARQRLTGTATQKATGYLITLAHGVDYGVFLEFARSKKYAIIAPTLASESKKVMDGLYNLFDKVK